VRGVVLNLNTHLVTRELAHILTSASPLCIVADIALRTTLLHTLSQPETR
jgi:hypothetical protein